MAKDADDKRAEGYFQEAFFLVEPWDLPPERSGAIPLLRKAAELGHLQAAFLLGERYFQLSSAQRGDPREKLALEAARWLQKASNKGHLAARWYLARLLHEGRGAPRDPGRTLKLLRQSAEGGEPRAQVDLGARLASDRGSHADWAQGIAWLTRAAEGGDARACEALGDALASPGRSGEEMKEAVRWWDRAASLGSVSAMTTLGRVYSTGDGVPKNLNRAREVLLGAVESDRPPAEAYSLLGQAFLKRTSAGKDYSQAFRYLRLAVDSGSADAMFHLGVCYYKGLGAPTDLKAAMELFEEVRSSGGPEAARLVREFLEGG
jgi:TPR repeat protein